jgi:hypothetical protein
MVPKQFSVFQDARGSLLPVGLDELGMEPKRIFVVTGGYAGVVRGGHGPKHGTQLIILVSGTVAVMVQHQHGDCEWVKLDAPGQSIRLSAGEIAWQRFADEQSRLLVIADTPFDPLGYVSATAPLSDADIDVLANL